MSFESVRLEKFELTTTTGLRIAGTPITTTTGGARNVSDGNVVVVGTPLAGIPAEMWVDESR